MPLEIFLSHSGVDQEWVQRIASMVGALDVTVYLFEHDAQPGVNVADKLTAAIRRADAVIVLLTRHGVASQYVNQEIGFARAEGKPIIPLVEVGISDSLLGMLAGIEHVKLDLADPHPAMTTIVAEVHRLVEQQRQDQNAARADAQRKKQERLELALAVTLVALVYLAATQT